MAKTGFRGTAMGMPPSGMRSQVTGLRPRHRHGVLLLIVLSLLVLFLMVGLSFIVSAGQFKQLSDQDAKAERTGMPGEKLANAALYQMLRGTDNQQSVVRGHSLLEDTYGRDFLKGTANSVADYESTGQHQTQVIQFDFASAEFQSEGNSVATEKLDDYFGGCVLTYTSGNAKGLSTRVVKFDLSPSAPYAGQQIILTVGVLDRNGNPPAADSEFIINGRPFNGVGLGYNPSTGRMDAQATVTGGTTLSVPAAFAPNLTLVGGAFNNLGGLNAYGGFDEPWDNVDYQNMFLAKASDTDNGSSSNTFVNNTGGAIPSFHRPFLYEYLRTNYESEWNNSKLRHLFVLRPTREDHPAFTGSNPLFDPILGPWDVDNDGEGTPDSVWLDVGLSPVSGPDGRLYKPLVAPLILPLDGRLNANTADTISRLTIDGTTSTYTTFESAVDALPANANLTLHNAFGGGFGAPDVALSTPAGPMNNNATAKRMASRYQPADQSVSREDSRPGLETTDDDSFWQSGGVGKQIVSTDYINENGVATVGGTNPIGSGFGSPSDLRSHAVPFIDTTGNLLWRHPIQVLGGKAVTADGVDDPYEVNPFRRTATDNLFDLNEFQSALRHDANPLLTGGDRFLPIKDSRLTPLSSYIPAPVTINSGRFRFGGSSGDGLRRSIRDVFAARLRRDSGGSLNDLTAFNLAETFVPAELLRGEKFNLNRVLRANSPQIPANMNAMILLRKQRMARDLYLMMMLVSEPQRDTAPLAYPEHPVPGVRTQQNLTLEQRQRLHARRIAQWAVNVVDFGDADSVMTRFVYDPTPFNDQLNEDPASATLVLSTDQQLQAQGLDSVWGFEHPELLLTETLAFHDRRVKDLPVGGKRKDNIGEEDDDDLDQDEVPLGSLFIELYCTRAAASPQAVNAQNSGSVSPRGTVVGLAGTAADLSSRPPEDVYNVIDGQPQPRLDLGKFPAGSVKPTWRLAISERHLKDPQDFDGMDSEISPHEARQRMPDIASFHPEDADRRIVGENNDLKDVTLERFVWFTPEPPRDTNPGPERQRNTFYARTDENSFPPQAKPGDYVIVGPRWATPVGPQTVDLRNPAGIRRGTPATRAIPVIAQTFRGKAGLSISEPTDTAQHYYEDPGINGKDQPYDEIEPDADLAGIPEVEQRPLWEPLPDPDAEEDEAAYTLASGTRENIRTVYLQRLADPNRPWDPVQNPYRTLDWMPIDLTVFNSADEETANNAPEDSAGNPLPFDPRDPKGVEVLGAHESWEAQDTTTQLWEETEFNFGSREKAGLGFNLWSADTRVISTTRQKEFPQLVVQRPGGKNGAAGVNLVKSLRDNPMYHTLGWLNRSWDVGQQTRPGFVNEFAYDGDSHVRVIADPYAEAPIPYRDPETNLLTTFPTLVWNNRPYANEYELLLVPATSQSRLTHQYSLSLPISPIIAPVAQAYQGYFGPFQHLLNFFQSSTGRPGEATIAQNFYRVFDWVHVPSRFRGSQYWFSAGSLQNNNPFHGSNLLPGTDNYFSRFREPGRIWVNGPVDEQVYLAMGMDGLPANTQAALGAPTNRFYNARDFEQTLAAKALPQANNNQGGPPQTSDPVRFPTGEFPAMYPNPVRAAAAADLLPEAIPGAELSVDATLLRSSSFSDPSLSVESRRQPALGKYRDVLNTGQLTQAQRSQGLSQYGHALHNRKTNAFFRYRDLQKVGGTASTQTNVFAVWITVGYFEIEPNFKQPLTDYESDSFSVDTLHPDGYSLGAEMGSELGTVTRHRSFYIIDRSVPVAFEPGVNHNVDDAILYRRVLD